MHFPAFMKSIAIAISIVLLCNVLHAQTRFIYKRMDAVPVIQYLDTLNFPFVGGFNNPQYSPINLNQDALPDLFVYDRSSNQVRTFLNTGSFGNVRYQYAPQYESVFPKDLSNWVLVRDYNCDGEGDIFTYAIPGSIKLYKGVRTGNQLSYQLISSALQYHLIGGTHGNVGNTSIDIPAIDDIDKDGDLDILTFDGNGSNIWYYTGQQVEQMGSCATDSLTFLLDKFCWGKVFDANYRSVILNYPCVPALAAPELGDPKGLKHSGNTLAAFDMDGDGDKDCLKGNVSYGYFNMLYNGGDTALAVITAQDTVFPSNSVAMNCELFPASYFLDVDNDGLTDLLGAPNLAFGSENYFCSWYYKNTGTATAAQFSFQSDSFLIDQMIEVGEGAYPALIDLNQDGLQDLVIGNAGYYASNGNYKAQLAYYQNTGSASAPAFTLVSKDWNNLSQLGLKGLIPGFGDIDNDGDSDMIAGTTDGKLNLFTNTGAGNFTLTQTNYQTIDVGDMATPQLIDLNGDGLLDLVIGEKFGNINYYQNTGTTTAPVFTFVTANLGGVDVRENGNITGYSAPHFTKLTSGNAWQLLVGNEEGHIQVYDHIASDGSGTYQLADYRFSGLTVGIRASVCTGKLTNSDTLQVVLGNYCGGVSLLGYDTLVINSIVKNSVSNNVINIYPVPSSTVLTIQLQTNVQLQSIQVIDAIGRIQKTISDNALSIQPLQISIADLSPGVYWLKLCDVTGKTAIKSFLKQ